MVEFLYNLLFASSLSNVPGAVALPGSTSRERPRVVTILFELIPGIEQLTGLPTLVSMNRSGSVVSAGEGGGDEDVSLAGGD